MRLIASVLLLFFISCTSQPESPKAQPTALELSSSSKALFAGGCFWCMEPPFDKLEGVLSTTSGFAGGTQINPAYKAVASGKTGHVEAVLIQYDPQKISYAKLLETYWRQINPTDSGGQFVDRGKQYRPVIFYYDEEQKKLAEQSKTKLQKLEKFKKPIIVETIKATSFYPASEDHQDYYQKNPIRYKYYRNGSGRDQYLKKIWGK